MNRLWQLFFLIFLFVAAAYSQTPSPALKPTPPDDDVVKISTNLIQIDVTVTDSKGKVVTDAGPDEMKVISLMTDALFSAPLA